MPKFDQRTSQTAIPRDVDPNECLVKLRLKEMLAEVLHNRLGRLLLCILSALVLSECRSDGYQHATISGDQRTRVRVLYDSPAIQSIVDQALQAMQERRRNLAF